MSAEACAFCGGALARGAGVSTERAGICAPCAVRGVQTLLAGAPGAAAGTPCTFCGEARPASSLRSDDGSVTICGTCLGEAVAALIPRRKAPAVGRGRTVADLVREHFDGVDTDAIVTSARTFPDYVRPDLDRALAERYAGARCVGVHQEHAFATLTIATLLHEHRDARVSIAPIRHDHVDVGADEPARCVVNALWLSTDGPHAVLLAPETNHGRCSGWHVEIAVPVGERGAAIVREVFEHVERAVDRSSSYRGKVLSLEAVPHMNGVGGRVTVHRLAPVARDEVVLPASTLALLERNVFAFAAQRPALAAMGLSVKKGLLFYGPPGTGKTHTLRYLAGALPGHTTLLVTAEQVGLLREYMALARLLSPSILVVEDADLIARQRGRMGSAAEEVLLNRLLNEMDGLKETAETFFVLTTNRPETLEAALTARPGRIDQAIEFPLPDADGRRKLARLYAGGARLADDTLEHVVVRTEGVSAAFVKELLRRSAQFALERGGTVVIERGDVDAAVQELLFVGGRLNAALLGALGATAE